MIMEYLTDGSLLSDLGGFIAGSGITGVVITIINKIKSKGEKRNEFADFLDKINTLFLNTINTMESTYKNIIETEQNAVEMANRNFEMSQQREAKQLSIINNERGRVNKLEQKNARKRVVINKAYECDIVKQATEPAQVCAVLKANAEYYQEKHSEPVQCSSCLESSRNDIN